MASTPQYILCYNSKLWYIYIFSRFNCPVFYLTRNYCLCFHCIRTFACVITTGLSIIIPLPGIAQFSRTFFFPSQLLREWQNNTTDRWRSVSSPARSWLWLLLERYTSLQRGNMMTLWTLSTASTDSLAIQSSCGSGVCQKQPAALFWYRRSGHIL